MKRELDPFESKLKEKLQGKASFPEDILWKRLNDELRRSDQQVGSKNRYWILGVALIVFISLGTGYFIGMRQGATKQIASNNLNKGTKQKHSQNTESSLSQLGSKRASLQVEKTKTTKTAIHDNIESLNLDAQNDHPIKTKKPKQDLLSSFVGIQTNDSKSIFGPESEQDLKNLTSVTHHKTNQEGLPSYETIHLNRSENTSSIPVVGNSIILSSEDPNSRLNSLDVDVSLDKLFIQHIAHLSITTSTSLANGTPYKKHLPTFLSASLGFEPTENNRFLTDRIYGTGSKFSSREKGLSTINLKLGFQAQLGHHLELGTGLGTYTYSTQQIAKNQIIKIDQLENQLNFESSISSFDIHEDDLFDDPEDHEENELNFEDSTSLHLNYQLSNTIKSIQVPITAGFVFHVNKCKVTMKTGLIFNHITQADQVVSISGFNAIRTNVQAQLVSNSFYQLFQVGAEFPMSEHVSLMLAPSYSHAIKSISKSSVLRPNSIGLECALKFYF